MSAVFKREFKAYFTSPIGWIYLAFGISYLIGIALNSTFIISTYKKLFKKESSSRLSESAEAMS